MKKSLIIMSLLLCTVFMVTGCENIDGVDESKYSVYEMHLYDDTFDHTEELVVKYDEGGNFKYAEYYMTYDSEKACEYLINNWNKKSEDSKYAEVKFDCKTVDGKSTLRWSMTDKSVDAGYLTDDKDFDSSLKYYYEKIKDEKIAKETFEGQVTRFREEKLFGLDERNYIIIDGERIDS